MRGGCSRRLLDKVLFISFYLLSNRSRSHILGIFELIIKQSGSKGSDGLGEIFPITSRSRLCSFPSIPSFHTRPSRLSPAPKSVLPTTPWVACGTGTIGLIWSCRRLTLHFNSRYVSSKKTWPCRFIWRSAPLIVVSEKDSNTI